MRWTTSTFCWLALAASAAWPLRAQDLAWQAEAGARSAALTVPTNGKPGFTLLSSAQTGIHFTNTLTELEGASNRVLLNGAGVAAGDFDHDGWPDLFLASLNGRNTLYKNLGGWKFADVTEQAGLKRDRRYYRGAVFADVNGDGSPDLLVCVLGGGTLCYLNDGKGRFTEATASARTANPFGGMTLALADVDGNGTLDLYVANNRTEDMRDRGQLNLRLVNGKMTVPPELKDRFVIMDGQVQEYGEPDQLYLNNGQGRFTPVSWTGGRFRDENGGPLAQPPLDWGLSAAFRDINEDGFPDLYVCNDFWTPDRVWLNDGKGRFRLAPRLALRNMSASSMGVDFADIDRDGHLDFFVADMLSREPRLRKRQKPAQNPMMAPPGLIEDRPQFMRNTLYAGRGDGSFAEIANFAGVAASEWSWSPVFLDVDLDGYEDLLITAGHAKDVQDMDAQAIIRAKQHSWPGFANEAGRQRAFTQELMEHMRLYPPLDAPVAAFRNLGGGRFEEATTAWGTDQPGVHHAIALADFDRDGDLDLVVNNLGSAAGIYRNDSTAPRVAVRLKGLPPNTQAIGAKVTLLGGAAPAQSQEMVSGGRYMAGSDPMLVFAAGGKPGRMSLEVTWRNGSRSVVTNVRANRLYELDEKSAATASGSKPETRNSKPPLFTDVSAALNHRHQEEPFDDFERQPLLPFKHSQGGPGVAWFDLDGDGTAELFIGSGRGGKITGHRVKGAGGFELIPSGATPPLPDDATGLAGWISASGRRALLAGVAGYENETPAPVIQIALAGGSLASSHLWPGSAPGSCALAVADFDGDGDLDVCAGGSVAAGRYPQATPARIYRCAGEQLELDPENTKTLAEAGLVNGAVWSDLNGDGFAELILACEWGPVRIFRNERGRLGAWDPPVVASESRNTEHGTRTTLNSLTGLWTGVTTGDLDGDGRLDIIAANWGLNSSYQASPGQPLQLVHGDLLERGTMNLIEAEWDPSIRATVPRQRLDRLSRELPMLPERFTSHRAFSEASLDDVLGPLQARARKAEAVTLASMIFLNRGDRFEVQPLPREAQWAPAFGVCAADFDGDGTEDVFLAQNFFALPGETPRLDAGRGLLLRGHSGEPQGQSSTATASHAERAVSNSPFPPFPLSPLLVPMPGQQSGIEVYGEQRGAAAADYDTDGRLDLVVAQNGAATKLFRNTGAWPGLRIRLNGPAGNPAGVGAQLRLKFGERFGPAREIHGGSGWWSQDDVVQVLGGSEKPTQVWIRWPGGTVSTASIPPDAREIKATFEARREP